MVAHGSVHVALGPAGDPQGVVGLRLAPPVVQPPEDLQGPFALLDAPLQVPPPGVDLAQRHQEAGHLPPRIEGLGDLQPPLQVGDGLIVPAPAGADVAQLAQQPHPVEVFVNPLQGLLVAPDRLGVASEEGSQVALPLAHLGPLPVAAGPPLLQDLPGPPVVLHRLGVGEAGLGLPGDLEVVGEGLGPGLGRRVVVGQPLVVLRQPVGVELFDGRRDTAVDRPPLAHQQRIVGHLLGESVPEGVLRVLPPSCQADDLGPLQPLQPGGKLLGGIADRLQHLHVEGPSDDGRQLERPSGRPVQPVQTGQNRPVEGGGDEAGGDVAGDAPAVAGAGQHPVLNEGADHLLQEHGVALGAGQNEPVDPLGQALRLQQVVNHLHRRFDGEAAEDDLPGPVGVLPLGQPAKLPAGRLPLRAEGEDKEKGNLFDQGH